MRLQNKLLIGKEVRVLRDNERWDNMKKLTLGGNGRLKAAKMWLDP